MGSRKFEVKEGRNRPDDSNCLNDTSSPGFMCYFVISRDFARMKCVPCCFPKMEEGHKEISHVFASVEKFLEVGVIRCIMSMGR